VSRSSSSSASSACTSRPARRSTTRFEPPAKRRTTRGLPAQAAHHARPPCRACHAASRDTSPQVSVFLYPTLTDFATVDGAGKLRAAPGEYRVSFGVAETARHGGGFLEATVHAA